MSRTNIAALTEAILTHIPSSAYTQQNLKVTDEWTLFIPNYRPIRLPIFRTNGWGSGGWQWRNKTGFLVELGNGEKRYADTFEIALRVSKKSAAP